MVKKYQRSPLKVNMAKMVADELLNKLNLRKEYGNLWKDLDPEIQDEIIEEFVDIIVENM